MENQAVEAPRPVNCFLDEAQNFMVGVQPDRVVIGMASSYSFGRYKQEIHILDFGPDLKSKGIYEYTPPSSGTQKDWNDTKDYLKKIGVTDRRAQVLNEDDQCGNAVYGNNRIIVRLLELHSALRSVRRFKGELETATEADEIDRITRNISDIELKKQKILASLKMAGYVLPFEV